MSQIPLQNTKPFKSYPDLVQLLTSRNMIIEDPARAERKLAQVGYYRLSGYWYPCREIEFDRTQNAVMCPIMNRPKRLSTFLPSTSFNKVFKFYLFDKRLRQALLNAIERVETHVRSIVAHELGSHDPLAFYDSSFIDHRNFRRSQQFPNGKWGKWITSHDKKLRESKADCIIWHNQQRIQIPTWVAIEAWDFGTLSHYFSMLQWRYQNVICSRLGINDPRTLASWLYEINILRNRCAHHSRVWNSKANNLLRIENNIYFSNLNLDNNARSRLYGMIAILWFLIKRIGPSSTWINQVAAIVNTKPELPGCSFKKMGFANDLGFPLYLFTRKSHVDKQKKVFSVRHKKKNPFCKSYKR